MSRLGQRLRRAVGVDVDAAEVAAITRRLDELEQRSRDAADRQAAAATAIAADLGERLAALERRLAALEQRTQGE